jgi:adenosine 3'-phospho 5'-phosphosulfate transporter B3
MVFRVPVKMYLLLALLTVATMGLSNASLGYLNYPTQVIFKCCKLIPVLIGGILIQGMVCITGTLTLSYMLCFDLE